MKKIILCLVTCSFLFLITPNIYSYDNEYVHQNININAAQQSEYFYNTMKRLGFKAITSRKLLELYVADKKVKAWFEEGAKLEDETVCRSRNHFHDPLKPWDKAGLNNFFINTFCFGIGEDFSVDSSIIWAQKQPELLSTKNYWSWNKAREYYYKALTVNDKNTKEMYFAQTFRSLGQVMHLIADSSVPAHVRNDIHVFPLTIPYLGIEIGSQTYESWARKNHKKLNYSEIALDNSIFNHAVYNSSAPVVISALWDQDKYDGTNLNVTTKSSIGLAEYTNANFFSEDTIFKDYPHPTYNDTNYPYIDWEHPEIVDAEDGKFDNRIYIRKIIGQPIQHLASLSYISEDLIKKSSYEYSPLVLDENVYKDYASLLIPRAVGYSAGLLNYFFRGNIEITLPSSGVYAQTDNPSGFTQIKLRARNITPDNEQMNNGTIELVMGYRLAIDDPFLNYPEDYPFRAENEIKYIVVPEANGIRSIPNDRYVELTFDLSSNPIPLFAINVFIRLIYYGQLGLEDGAVVVGFKDISEPTPVDLFNDMDQICLNGRMYVAGSAEAIDQVDTNNNGIPIWDVYPHDISNIYFRTSPKDIPQYASVANHNIAVSYLNAGHSIRASYILTDYTFSYNSYQTLVKTIAEDPWVHTSWRTEVYPGMAIKNQVEYEEDPDVCAPMEAPCHIWWYPTFLEYRGMNIWWGGGIMYINKAYPQGSECDCYQGVLRTCISNARTLKATGSNDKSISLRKSSADVSISRTNMQMLPLNHKQRHISIER